VKPKIWSINGCSDSSQRSSQKYIVLCRIEAGRKDPG
jgi:hypothetical protein